MEMKCLTQRKNDYSITSCRRIMNDCAKLQAMATESNAHNECGMRGQEGEGTDSRIKTYYAAFAKTQGGYSQARRSNISPCLNSALLPRRGSCWWLKTILSELDSKDWLSRCSWRLRTGKMGKDQRGSLSQFEVKPRRPRGDGSCGILPN